MKQALLMLVGGRQVPNLLVAQYLRPELIVSIASREAMQTGDAWSRIEPALLQISPEGVTKPIEIDAFDLAAVRDACNRAIKVYRDVEWVFNITCATTIMSIGAYEVAQAQGASAWYLDTATHRVITLTGEPPKDNLYKLNVADYLEIYGRKPAEIEAPPSALLLAFANALARNPDAVMRFRSSLRNAQGNLVRKDQEKVIELRSNAAAVASICQSAQQAGFIRSYKKNGSIGYSLEVCGSRLWHFIDGLWLEIFAWAAAREAGCFDDCRYGLKIPGEYGLNELDLAATQAATLLIAECKTDEDAYRKDAVSYLDKLNSIAGMIGGNYVGRLFITSQSVPRDPEKLKSYQSFINQARERQIVVITGDQLGNLTEILRREAGGNIPGEQPSYRRS